MAAMYLYFLVAVALPAQLFAQLPARNVDPIFLLSEAYSQESLVVGRNPGIDRVEFFEHWLRRFQQVVMDNPLSPMRDVARSKINELLNGLGRWRESLEVYDLRLLEATSEHQRGQFWYDIGEVAYNGYFVERDDALAVRSIESFAKAREVKGNGPWAIVGLQRSAQLEAFAFGNHCRAGDLYVQSFEVAERLAPPELTQMGETQRNLLLETALQGAVREFAAAEDGARALEAIRRLESLENRRLPMEIHLGVLLGEGHQREGLREYCDYVDAWLRRRTYDETMLNLMATLAFHYQAVGARDRAVAWNEAVLRRAEEPTFPKDKAELLKSTVHRLRVLYTTAGEHEKRARLDQRIATWDNP